MNSTLRYIIRVIKSFIWFVILFAIVVTIIVLIVPQYHFDMIFKETGGLFAPDAKYKILILFIAISAVYPAVKYVKKEAVIKGTFEENREKIIGVFNKLGYELTSEDAQKASFRLANKSIRFMRMYEDTITITKGESPLILRGDRKEIIRISDSIMYAVNNTEEEEK